MPKFKYFPDRPEKLTAPFVSEQYIKLLALLPEAETSESPDKWFDLFKAWNDFGCYLGSEGARIEYALSNNMGDPELNKAEEYFRNEIAPLTDAPEHTLVNAFLSSKHKDAMAAKFGEQLVPDFETLIKPLDPVNTKLRTKLAELSTRYDKLIASGEVIIGDEKMTLWKARSLGGSDDAAIRKEAYLARADWLLAHQAEIAGIYDEMVKLRHQMAKNVGYDSYIPLAYEGMGRTDYDPLMVEQFRNHVKEFVVPLRLKLAERQRVNLKTAKLAPWDAMLNMTVYNPEISLPLGTVPIDSQLDQAQKLFDSLSPQLGDHFKKMRKLNLIDLANRPGKRSGAFCITFSDEQKVAIFLNSTGDADDVHTLTHEMGHAFQGWESQHIETVSLQHPTTDLCEVHSMGMEFLSLPHIGEFFSKQEDADKFRKGLWWEAVDVLTYVCLVDEFQHWVYGNPEATPEDRDKQWDKLMDEYCPGADWTGLEKYKKTRWYIQGHIFGMPFYYIDYALAQTGALQLSLMDAEDHNKTLETYLELCRIGGTKSILKAFSAANLRSPFDETLMSDLMKHTSGQLGL